MLISPDEEGFRLPNFHFIDCHMHFHDPEMTTSTITEIIKEEFPHIKSFYETSGDNSALLGLMDAINCKQAWIINYESVDTMGYDISTNDWVHNFCENSHNRLIPIGGVNPKRHENAAEMMQDYVESGMIRGMKVHPSHQLLYPNEYTKGLESQRKLYAVCEELQIPVMFHTGSSIFPLARSKFANPLCLEDILIDFPELIMIQSHGGRPFWMRESEYLMIKFPQLYLDLAGVPPKLLPEYFPRFERYAERVLFGSDYPSPGVPSPRENAEVIADLPLPKATIDKILFGNAMKLMKK